MKSDHVDVDASVVLIVILAVIYFTMIMNSLGISTCNESISLKLYIYTLRLLSITTICVYLYRNQ